MSLRALKSPQGLNSGAWGSCALGTMFNKGGKYLPLDKRGGENIFQQATSVVDLVGDWANTISNLAGSRSPYYVIGEIKNSSYDTMYDEMGALGNAVRAVSSIVMGNIQNGVIIDSIGSVDADISVEYTGNPIYYQASDITNSRVRKPTIVRAVVAVSNYLNDDLLGATLSSVAGLDGSGILSGMANILMYGGKTRAQYALAKLRWLQENGIPFRVYTPHGYYDNMLIQDIKPKTDAESMDMLLCEITYKEVLLAAPYLSKAELAKRNLLRTNVTATTSTFGERATGALGDAYSWTTKLLGF